MKTRGRIILAFLALLWLGECAVDTHCIVTTGGECGNDGAYDPY
jgi:hypothetical protein